MLHNVSTVDGKVTADERERLAATHGAAIAAEIIAEVEGQYLSTEDQKPAAKAKTNKAAPPASAPTSETEE